MAQAIFMLCKTKPFAREYVLADQLRRAAVSIPANIAEGFERGTRPELIHFCYVARGSAGELRSHLALAVDTNLISQVDYERLREECLSLSRKVTRFIDHLKRTQDDFKGIKFVIPTKGV